MTDAKILEVLGFYEKKLEVMQRTFIGPGQMEGNTHFAHLLTMIPSPGIH